MLAIMFLSAGSFVHIYIFKPFLTCPFYIIVLQLFSISNLLESVSPVDTVVTWCGPFEKCIYCHNKCSLVETKVETVKSWNYKGGFNTTEPKVLISFLCLSFLQGFVQTQ